MPAYRWGSRTWTFADLARDSNRLANALLTKHHVPCMLQTIAALKLGAVCMPVDWRLAPAEAEYIIDFVDALLRNPSGKILKRVLREPYWQGQQRSVA